MSLQDTKDKVMQLVENWTTENGKDCIDVLIATPPCQGMSEKIIKKNDEM